jgi:hypothetical protein
MKKQRKHYTPEEKVAILRRHLVEGVPILDLCDELGLQPTVTCSPGISRRFRPTGIGSWKRLKPSEELVR